VKLSFLSSTVGVNFMHEIIILYNSNTYYIMSVTYWSIDTLKMAEFL